MTTKEKTKKTTIQQLREIRDKVSQDIRDMNFEELDKYLKNKKPIHPVLKK